MTRVLLLCLSAIALVAAIACNDGDSKKDEQTATSAVAGTPGQTAASTENVTLRLAYFPNITHAPALVGLQRGTFEQTLSPNVTLKPTAFNAGPDVIEALFAGEIDIAYIGPNPTVNGYVQSNGDALRAIAGATSGGALLVVRADAGISSAADLDGKKIASPQLGNTQDVALRAYLEANGLNAQEQGGNVQVIPTKNADTLTLFQQGQIDGAWVPEPWATRLVQEAGGTVLVDERTLWPNGDFVTTNVIVSKEFLEDHPDVVTNFLKAHVETIQWIAANAEEAKQLTNAQIEADSTAALAPAVIDAAWANLKFTYDPLAATLLKSADDAFRLDFLDSEPDLSGLYALDLLNSVLQELGLPAVSDQ